MENRVSSHQLAIAAEQNIIEGEYWLKKLSGDLVKNNFPYDFKKKDIDKYMMREEKFNFSPGLFSALMTLSKGSDVRLHIILVTGMFILLNKYSGNNDIIIGSSILKQEIDDQYINTLLVFRSQVRDDTSFKELLLQVKDVIIEANKNQNYPMEKLLERLNIPIVGNEFPLFDVVVLLENLYDKRFIQHIHYNMGFYFLNAGESIESVVEYNTLLYRESTIKQITRHYMNVLGQVLPDVNVRLSEIQLLSEEERKQVLFDFNHAYPASDYPADKTLSQLFAEQAARTPDHIALIGMPRQIGRGHRTLLTYNQLNHRVNQVAEVLKNNGVGPDTIVGLMEQFSIDMMVGILAILKAGGAYLPIDPDYPQDRIEFMLNDSRAKVLQADFVSTPGAPSSTLTLSEVRSSYRVSPPATLAYIIYTSGTTGKPKGVMVEHRNVIAYLHAFYQEFEITPADTVIQLASYSFDAFVEEVFPLLLKGGKILIPAPFEIMDINALAWLIVKHQVSMIDCTPLLLSEFNKLNSPSLPENPFKSVHIFISGGDVLKREYVDNLLNIGKVYNTYGPTETTVCATYYHYTHSYTETGDDTVIDSTIPIGKPIANYSIYILDKSNTPVPIGVTGELCIVGDGVTRGYLNCPELTAEKFCYKNFLLKGTRGLAPLLYASLLYRTGDLARWLPDGSIEFLGRKDDQVKIRGYRIETGEIETRLMKLKQYPIKEAIVMAREDKDNEKYLCAYIAAEEEFELSGLRNSLAGELPQYMIPSFFVPIREIP
ncbi:MAG: amino acid adenylation domain-containing protein, partial [Candidatus Aminicenantes bacterium]